MEIKAMKYPVETINPDHSTRDDVAQIVLVTIHVKHSLRDYPHHGYDVKLLQARSFVYLIRD